MRYPCWQTWQAMHDMQAQFNGGGTNEYAPGPSNTPRGPPI